MRVDCPDGPPPQRDRKRDGRVAEGRDAVNERIEGRRGPAVSAGATADVREAVFHGAKRVGAKVVVADGAPSVGGLQEDGHPGGSGLAEEGGEVHVETDRAAELADSRGIGRGEDGLSWVTQR